MNGKANALSLSRSIRVMIAATLVAGHCVGADVSKESGSSSSADAKEEGPLPPSQQGIVLRNASDKRVDLKLEFDKCLSATLHLEPGQSARILDESNADAGIRVRPFQISGTLGEGNGQTPVSVSGLAILLTFDKAGARFIATWDYLPPKTAAWSVPAVAEIRIGKLKEVKVQQL